MFSKIRLRHGSSTMVIKDTLCSSGVRGDTRIFLGKLRNLMLTKTRVETASLLERGRHDCRRGGQVKPPFFLLLQPKSGPSWEPLHFTFSFYF